MNALATLKKDINVLNAFFKKGGVKKILKRTVHIT